MAPEQQTDPRAENYFPLPDSVFVPRFLRGSLQRFLRLNFAERDCQELRHELGLLPVLEQILRARGIEPEMVRERAKALPDQGPLLITSNHPTGILDGVLLMFALLGRRQDVKVVANRMLEKIPHFNDYLISVDKYGGKSANIRTARQILKAWQAEACVILFPAGTVAHWQLAHRAVAEAPEEEGLQRLAAKLGIPHCQATLFLKNPAWFHCAAAVSRQARTALLVRAFYAKPTVLQTPPLQFHEIQQQFPPTKLAKEDGVNAAAKMALR